MMVGRSAGDTDDVLGHNRHPLISPMNQAVSHETGYASTVSKRPVADRPKSKNMKMMT